MAVLARGQRSEEIKTDGLVLQDAATDRRTVTRVNVVDMLDALDAYDLILVLIPKHQVASILPIISANKSSTTIMFMLNNPSGFDDWVQTVGRKRLLIGFPGAGGKREDGVVHYRILPKFAQPTTIGELDGSVSNRIKTLANLFQKAGLPTSTSSNMDAWLKYHVAWTSPMFNTIYLAGGDGTSLAGNPKVIRLMIQAVREGFLVLRTLGFPVTPSNLRINWELFPVSSMMISSRLLFRTKFFADVAGGHAKAALPEFKVLSDEFQNLAGTTTVPTPAIDELHNHLMTLETERSNVQ